MLAEHEDRVLLGRQPQYPPGRYSALAGFVEPGESIEEAVARELMEEAGVAVGDVRYVASQPWPFPGSLMIACLAEAESDALTLDRNELEDAFWATAPRSWRRSRATPGAPFLAPPPFAIANTLLTRWSRADEKEDAMSADHDWRGALCCSLAGCATGPGNQRADAHGHADRHPGSARPRRSRRHRHASRSGSIRPSGQVCWNLYARADRRRDRRPYPSRRRRHRRAAGASP